MSSAGFRSRLFIVVLSLLPIVASAQVAPYEVIHTLTGSEGRFPESGLVRGADNRLYGAANEGGADGVGTIFRIQTDGTFELVHTFLATTPDSGLNPVSLIRGRDKNLYGTTDYGGAAGDGVIYRLNWIEASQTYAGVDVIHAFDCAQGDGGDPWSSLIEGPDGALYGMTNPTVKPDPACSLSTVFKVDKDGSGFAVLATFDYLVTGSYQFGALAIGSDGSVFGTLCDSYNSAFALGSVFKIAPDGRVTYPKVFDGTDGAYPFSGLVRGVDGAFYGTTSGGGANDVGTLFRIDESGNFTSLYSFESGSIHTPYSPLIVGGDGMVYGAAHSGGAAGVGGTYTFDPPAPIGSGGGFTLHSTFDDPTTGSSSWGPLGVGPVPERHLYGTQGSGGSTGQGTLFGLLDIQVANQPPVPFITASPNPALSHGAGATVFLSALGTSDADFDELAYSWTLPAEATNRFVAVDHSTVSATFPVGTWPVTLTVSDGTVTRSIEASVTVSGLIVPSNIIVEATGPSGTVVTYSVHATSVAGEPSEPICSHASGSVFRIGETTVTCSFTDPDMNLEVAASFDVTVVADMTPPVLSLPSTITVQATGASGAAVTYSASASDNVLVTSVSCNAPSGSTFVLGPTVVQCAATDAAGNNTSGTFTANVIDTVGPVISAPANIVVTASSGTNVSYPAATAIDLVSGARPVSCTPASGSVFPVGVTTVTCVSHDARGNSTSKLFTVTVVATPPTLNVTLTPGVLWPPNHKMVTITATIAATSEGGLMNVTLLSITSNEPDNGLGDGDTVDDIQGETIGTNDRVFQVRSERSGKGTDRVYTVTYRASLQSNASIATVATATVVVPHDMRGKK